MPIKFYHETLDFIKRYPFIPHLYAKFLLHYSFCLEKLDVTCL